MVRLRRASLGRRSRGQPGRELQLPTWSVDCECPHGLPRPLPNVTPCGRNHAHPQKLLNRQRPANRRRGVTPDAPSTSEGAMPVPGGGVSGGLRSAPRSVPSANSGGALRRQRSLGIAKPRQRAVEFDQCLLGRVLRDQGAGRRPRDEPFAQPAAADRRARQTPAVEIVGVVAAPIYFLSDSADSKDCVGHGRQLNPDLQGPPMPSAT